MRLIGRIRKDQGSKNVRVSLILEGWGERSMVIFRLRDENSSITIVDGVLIERTFNVFDNGLERARQAIESWAEELRPILRNYAATLDTIVDETIEFEI